jgi:hypothetical protein
MRQAADIAQVAQASACDYFLNLHETENHRLKPVPPKSGTWEQNGVLDISRFLITKVQSLS